MMTVKSIDLEGIVTNALQRMAFVFAEPAAITAGEVLARGVASASIDLRGTSSFVVTVTATGGLVQEIASGMIGCDPEEIDVDDHGRATVLELANIFGGELVMQLATHTDCLLIGLPRDVSVEDAGSHSDQAQQTGLCCIVGSDAGQLLVAVAGE